MVFSSEDVGEDSGGGAGGGIWTFGERGFVGVLYWDEASGAYI